MASAKKPTAKGLRFTRKYTRDDINVFDQFTYDYRTSVIRNPSGEVVCEINNVVVPKQWSQIATDILAQKYFRKAGVPQPDGSLGRKTIDQANGQLNKPTSSYESKQSKVCFILSVKDDLGNEGDEIRPSNHLSNRIYKCTRCFQLMWISCSAL